MQFQNEIDMEAEPPGVLSDLRTKCFQVFRTGDRIKRITIHDVSQTKREKKFNGITFKADEEVDPETVAEWVMRAVDAYGQEKIDALDEGEPLPTIEVKLYFIVDDTNKQRKGSREQRHTWGFTYRPGDQLQPFVVGEEHQSNPLLDVVDKLLATIDRQTADNERLFDRLMEMTKLHASQTEPLLQITAFMGQVGLQGWEMQMRMLAYQGQQQQNEESVRAEQRKAEENRRRMNALLDKLAPAVKKGIQQAAEHHFKEKGFGGIGGMVASVASMMDDDEQEGAVEEAGEDQHDEGSAESAAEVDPEAAKNPAATFAQALGTQITAAQWPELSAALTKAQMRHLGSALNATTDGELVKAFDAFMDGMDLSKLQKLQGIFTSEQLGYLEQLGHLVAAAKEEAEKTEGEG